MYAFADTDKPTSSVQLLSVEETDEGTQITWVTTVDSELPKEDGTFYLRKNGEQVEIASPTVVEEVIKEKNTSTIYSYLDPTEEKQNLSYIIEWETSTQTIFSNEWNEAQQDTPAEQEAVQTTTSDDNTEETKNEEKQQIKETLLNNEEEITAPAELVEYIEETVQDETFKASLFEFIEEEFDADGFFFVEKGFVNESSFQVYFFGHVPNVRVAKYELSLDGEFVASLKSRNYDYTFTGLNPSTTYEVGLKAFDKNNNLLLEETISVTTLAEPTGETVTFADANLEKAIQAQLGLTRELRESDLENITYLFAIDLGITDITGIEKLVNLETLYLFSNEISDITPLQGLTGLVDLDIDMNNITNVDVLSQLTNLRVLWLANNPVADISKLDTLVNMEALFLHDTNIADISVIENMPHLSHLTIGGSLVDYSEGTSTLALLLALKDAGVYVDVLDDEDYWYEFDVWVDGVNENAAHISWYYYSEEELDLSYRVQLNWEEIAVTKDWGIELTGLTPETTYEVFVEVLDEAGEVIDFGYVMFDTPSLPSGEVVTIPDEQLLQAIKETLFIHHRPIYESDMLRLNWLDAVYSGIESLEGLQYARNLESLYIVGNEVEDLSPLADLDFLMFLNASENNISSIEPLRGLFIFDLDLSYNPITDISVLSSLEDITLLYLHGTNITDISVLLELEFLEYVTLYHIEGLTFEEGTPEFDVVQQLMARGVWVVTNEDDLYPISDIEFEVLDVTDTEIELAWDYFGEESVVGYLVSIFHDDMMEMQEFIEVEEGYHFFEDLLPETLYTIEVLAISEDGYFADYNFIEIMTEPTMDEQPVEEEPIDEEETVEEPKTPVEEKEDKNPVSPVVKEDKKNKTETGKKLPNTATNVFNYFAIGLVMLLVGGLFLLVVRRRMKVA